MRSPKRGRARSCGRGTTRARRSAKSLPSPKEEELGELETAIGTLKYALHHAVGDDGRTGAIHTDIGDIYARRGQASEAEYHFRRAQRLAPDDESLQARLDWCAHADGGLDATTSRTDIGAVHA